MRAANLATLIALAACLSGPALQAKDSAPKRLVTLATKDALATYDLSRSGRVKPLRLIGSESERITQLHSQLGSAFNGRFALDPVHQEIVVEIQYRTFSAFARMAAGSAVALRTMTVVGPSGGLFEAFAVDPQHDEILIADGSVVATYSRLATGQKVDPIRIQGKEHDGNFRPRPLALDTLHDEIITLRAESEYSSAVLSIKVRPPELLR